MKNREPGVRIYCINTGTKEKTNSDGVLFTNNIFTPCLDTKNKPQICKMCSEKRNSQPTQKNSDTHTNQKD